MTHNTKSVLFPILKALGLTAGLNAVLLLLIYLFSPIAAHSFGQILLILSVVLLLLTAACLYTRIAVHRRRELWYGLAVALPLHLIASVVSVLIYGNRLSEYWPGFMDMAWLVFLLLSLATWCTAICTATLLRHARMSEPRREEKRRIRKASSGLHPEIITVTPVRTRLIAALKGISWTLGFYVLTGLLLELLSALSIAETILSFVAFPCLWCIMAVVYGLTCPPSRGIFTLSVSLTHLLLCIAVMVFLIPANITEHVGYALVYLDSVLTDPFSHPEQLLLIAEFLSVWAIVIAHSVRRPKK